MLVRLLYASRAVKPIDAKTIEAILVESRAHNQERGITGVLASYENGNVFMQVLEGSRDEVNRLYNAIVKDPRHTDVILLDYAEIAERRFASWRMGRVDLTRVNASAILRFSEKATLDPFVMSGKAALAMLEELATTMPG